MKLKPVQEQRDVNVNFDKIQSFLGESSLNKEQLRDLSFKVETLEEQFDSLRIPASVSVRTFNNTVSRMREQFETELQSLIAFVNNEQARLNQLQEDVYVDKKSSKILENYNNKIQKLRLDFESEFRDMRKQIEERQRQIEHNSLKLEETVYSLRDEVATVNESLISFDKKGTTLFNEVSFIKDNIDIKIKEFNSALEENAIRLEDYQNKQQPQFAAIFETVQSLETAILHIEQHPEISKIKDMSKNIMNLQRKVEKDIKEYNEYLLNKTVEIDEHIEDKIDHITGFIVELAEADEQLEQRLSKTENYKQLIINQQKVNEDLQDIRSELEAVNESLFLENRELRKNAELLTEDLKKALAFFETNSGNKSLTGEVLTEEAHYSPEGPSYIKEYAERLDKLIKHDYNETQKQLISEVNIQGEKPILYKDFAKYINKLQSTIALLGGGGSGSIFDIDYVKPGVNPSSLNDGDGLVWDSANQYFAFAPVGGGSTAGIGSTTALAVYGFFGTPQTITESINLPTGFNWFGVGPVNVSTGATINVEGTATLTIL